jgi:thiol-disulfide isomerase/thioredoxin
MKKLLLTVVAFGLWVSAAAAEPPREASVILKEFNEVKEPVLDRTKVQDRSYVQTYIAERTKALEKQNALAWELYQADPKHAEVGKLLVTRWTNMTRGPEAAKAGEEIAKFLKDNPDSPHKADILFQRAAATLNRGDTKASLAAIEEFIAAKPKDDRGGSLLGYVASNLDDQAEQLKLLRRVIADYPDSPAALSASGSLRQVDGIGKPFELTFEDAISGKTVSMKALQGKVVVVDFWATWCGPCVAEMPTMKKLYAEHKDHGVEFIGISLDNAEGGLDALKKFVQEKEITWPQYFQGNGWQSKFSASWGINGIPCLFIVDAEGNLHSTNARGQLETLIPELVKKRDEKK